MKKQLLILLSFIFCMISPSINANDAQKRITPDKVTIHNYEQFIAQLERDLPKGTPVEDIKKYLSENKIEYSYYSIEIKKDLADSLVEKDFYRKYPHFQFMLRRISSFFIFYSDLLVFIFFSEETGVVEIRHDLIHTGP